jgi:D-arginine dehydrogenase
VNQSGNNTDFLVVGAGIAGLATAAELCELGTVTVLEAESGPAQHASGRSAAVFIDWYGGKLVQPFTRISRTWFEAFSGGFEASTGILSPRGLLLVADYGDEKLLIIPTGNRIEKLSRTEVLGLVPRLREGTVSEALYDPSVADINVPKLIALHERRIRTRSGCQINGARVTRITRNKQSWTVEAGNDTFSASVLVNCAGPWADEIGMLAGLAPIELSSLRRTVCIFKAEDSSVGKWPLVHDAKGRFYFKPYSGFLLASPDDEIPSAALDAQPDERDVARTVSIIKKATTLAVNGPVDRWAGLRTFSPDCGLVLGPDPQDHAFMWCAGLGGVGIQTSPAAAMCIASFIDTGDILPELARTGITGRSVSPERFLNADCVGP